MLRFRRLLISMIAALAAAGLVYAVYMTLLHQIELQETTTVIVPSRFIQEGTVITEELLTHRSVIKAAVDEDMLVNADELIGRQTLVPLGADEPVLAWKVTDLLVLPFEEESTFEIPKEYIRSVSGGIREGDLVRIYVSGDGNERRLLLQDVRVASVRLSDDTRSREEAEPQGQDDQLQRLLAMRSAKQVERINLNLTEDQWILLDRACRQPEGGKLVIALPGDQTVIADFMENSAGSMKNDISTTSTLQGAGTASPIDQTMPSVQMEEAGLPDAEISDPAKTPSIAEEAVMPEGAQPDHQPVPLETMEKHTMTDDEGGELE